MSLMITGFQGFVGGHLTKLLDEKKIKWVGYDLKSGDDIRDKCKLDKFFEENQVTEVIHLAALAGVRRGNEYPDDYVSTNIQGTWNITKMCEKYGVKHLVFYSSSSVYGNNKPPICENYAKNPISLYGISKLAGENIVNSSKVPQVTVVIPFTVVGENGRKDEVIYKWLEQYKNGKKITIYGDGSSKRGYVNVHDLVGATVKIIHEKANAWERETFNLGGSEVIELRQIIDIFKEELPDALFEELPLPSTDIYKNYADTSRALNKLGFEPKPSFEKLIKNIIKSELKK